MKTPNNTNGKYKSNYKLNKNDYCVEDKLVRSGIQYQSSGDMSIGDSIIPDDMVIYLYPNSMIKISETQVINADNLDLNTGSSSNMINELTKIRDDCNLSPGKLSLIAIGKDTGSFSHSIKTKEYPAVIFFEKGLFIQTKNNNS
jgi:hypothetical protein